MIGHSEVEYASLIGASREVAIAGRPISNMFFWTPLRNSDSIGWLVGWMGECWGDG